MSTILDKIIANKKIEISKHKEEISLQELENKVKEVTQKFSFKESLQKSSTGIISEFKRRSPSKDWIFKEAKIEEVIPYYSKGGASAISVLTDFDFFGGNLNDLKEASLLTNTPLLRKDFMVDEYQIYQAKLYGASAILLIAAALTIEETKNLAKKAKELGLDVLLEIHNEQELDHINEYVDVVGVNNRNLKTFVTDVQVSFQLVEKIPNEFVKISESGISSSQTVKELQQVGYQGFLMGENFMKTSNPGEALEQFIKELR
ncbi:indole-3-glycerol phosphate synthase TrpC [Apibacter muscae]|uniref:Indole-3-glycerol phosphate synthase n=1 Tax=Apibacter muscae TaxID=2509004 RepID=A0A563DK28_9FLAO|nr:indole-3-glycerol phosphate synthase TrpC [Apibacter muscae]TWP30598.1 indole-3-glycerol phosphate synthase TrpC [Apibacter muscae]TWP31434.1 indole-3-glycerol phosphate synthase TrpC [Apibacter muscae]